MATQLFLRETAATTHQAANLLTRLGSSGLQGFCRGVSTSRGASATTTVNSTINNNSQGRELTKTTVTDPQIWISEPLDADTTISGTITVNLRAAESNMAANARVGCDIYHLDAQTGVETLVGSAAFPTELGTTEAAQNWTITPTSTAFLKGDRILIRPYWINSGTSASGYTVTVWYDGPTAAASGDSYVTFTENFGFLSTTPAGTQLFLTDTAGPTVTGRDSKLTSTSRGAGVTSLAYEVAIPVGPTRPYQFRDNGGGADDIEQTDISTTLAPLPGFDASTEGGAQSFTPAANLWVWGLWFELNNSGGAGSSYNIAIRGDSGSNRPGGSTYFTDTDISVGGYNGYYGYDTDFAVVASTKYWFTYLGSTVNAANYLLARGSSTDTYAGGSYIHTANSGSTWTDTTTDWGFRIYTGTVVEWYTPQLTAFTLSDLVTANLRLQASSATGGLNAVCEIAICDEDGSNVTVWGLGRYYDLTLGGSLTVSEAAYNFIIAGDDTAVTDGQRLRIRVLIDYNSVDAINGGPTQTMYYNGTSAAASGDAYVTLTQSVTEFGPPATLVLQQGFVDHGNPGVL